MSSSGRDKQFTFEKKEPYQVCSLRKYHIQDDYIYQRKRDRLSTDVITRCRECKTWLLVQMSLAPSSQFTGQEAWHVTSRLATKQEIEDYTRLGKVRDI